MRAQNCQWGAQMMLPSSVFGRKRTAAPKDGCFGGPSSAGRHAGAGRGVFRLPRRLEAWKPSEARLRSLPRREPGGIANHWRRVISSARGRPKKKLPQEATARSHPRRNHPRRSHARGLCFPFFNGLLPSIHPSTVHTLSPARLLVNRRQTWTRLVAQ